MLRSFAFVLVLAAFGLACSPASRASHPDTSPEGAGDAGASASAGGPAGADAGPDAGTSTLDAGWAFPTPDAGMSSSDAGWAFPAPLPPTPDYPAACTQPIRPQPDLSPEPVRPCTEETSGSAAEFRYDSTGRVVYRASHSTLSGQHYEYVYRSDDSGDTRIEETTFNGVVTDRRVTQLKDGLPLEQDQFTALPDGTLDLVEHLTWSYDAYGRQSLVVSQRQGSVVPFESDYYDSAGRLYLVYQNQYGGLGWHYRSWFANGSLAHEVGVGYTGSAVEKRWDACGNLTYNGFKTSSGRGSIWTDWSWDREGFPASRHIRSRGTVWETNSTESYALDDTGRALSSLIVVTNPPEYDWLPPTETHHASYAYDSAGHVIDHGVDGKTDFHARYDDAGRLVELGLDPDPTRWTYDGCGR
jgi:hypothetical protein